MKRLLVLISITGLLWGMNCLESNGRNMDNNDEQIYLQQIKEQNKLLIEALDKFGANSKDKVISIYANGIKERSGPLQYSVMCRDLKKKFKQEMNNNNNYSWITGYSSPWVKDYKVLCEKENKDGSYDVTIKFFWETSSGPFNESITRLKIISKNNIWCIVDIQDK
ncbi:MAG: hypothetical protein ACRDA3_14130 [Peptostreptococcaceae bacterium]